MLVLYTSRSSLEGFVVKMFMSAIKSSPFPSFFEAGLPSRAKVTMVTDGYPSKSPPQFSS